LASHHGDALDVEPIRSPTQPLGFHHQCLAGLDHLLDPLEQCIAGSLLRFPVRPLTLVDLDALPSCLGGAIRAALATDDGVFDGSAKQKSGVI
jgi:hypothetical protein